MKGLRPARGGRGERFRPLSASGTGPGSGSTATEADTHTPYPGQGGGTRTQALDPALPPAPFALAPIRERRKEVGRRKKTHREGYWVAGRAVAEAAAEKEQSESARR